MLVGFAGSTDKKSFHLERLTAHMAAGELRRDKTWDGRRGNAIGCLVHKFDYAFAEAELGVPERVLHLVEWFFQKLPASNWPLQAIEAIPVGADLSTVWRDWVVRVLSRQRDLSCRIDEMSVPYSLRKPCSDVIDAVIAAYSDDGYVAHATEMYHAAWAAAKPLGQTSWWTLFMPRTRRLRAAVHKAAATAAVAARASDHPSSAIAVSEDAAEAAALVGWNANEDREKELARQAEDLLELLADTVVIKGGAS